MVLAAKPSETQRFAHLADKSGELSSFPICGCEWLRHVATTQSLSDSFSSAVSLSHSPFLSSNSLVSSYRYLPSSSTIESIQIVSPLVKPRQTSIQSIPLSQPIPASLGPGRQDSDLSFFALPQPTLPYYAAL